MEIVGHYNPLTEPSTIVIKEDRARYWLGQGAQPTERVAKLLKIRGITDEGGKVVAVAAEAEAEATPAAETAADAGFRHTQRCRAAPVPQPRQQP